MSKKWTRQASAGQIQAMHIAYGEAATGWVIATFLHLNGPPGVGKSTIAAALVATHPLALGIEIDVLRTWLGRWADEERSKGIAREMASTMAAEHLARGLDVVMPQLDVRHEVIAHLEAIALERDARFVEVILTAPEAEVAARIAEAPEPAGAHPRVLFTADELATQITRYTNSLRQLARDRRDAVWIDVAGLSPGDAASAVKTAIAW